MKQKIPTRLRLARLAGRSAEKAQAERSVRLPGEMAFLAAGRRQVNPFNMEFIRAMSEPSENGCRNWKGSRCTDGYGMVNFYGRRWMTHRATYFLTFGEIPDDKVVMHKCDNPTCVNPSHLILGTERDNMLDCISKFRGGSQKLSINAVKLIRKEYSSTDISQYGLADKYGVTQSNISKIISYERFSNV